MFIKKIILSINYLIRLLTFFLIIFVTSCRCSTTYLPGNSLENTDTTIHATASMWQGQYEYLAIDIKIERIDSLFVKNITVTPTITKGKFFPWFNNFVMYSYYYEKEGRFKGGPYWKDFSADTFDKLPTENRVTNKNKSYVGYSAHYNSKRPIKFKNFSADIEVILVDLSGQPIVLKRHFDFYGNRDCYFSAH